MMRCGAIGTSSARNSGALELVVAVERLGAPGRRRRRCATGAAQRRAQPVEHDAGVADEHVVDGERPRRR